MFSLSAESALRILGELLEIKCKCSGSALGRSLREALPQGFSDLLCASAWKPAGTHPPRACKTEKFELQV